MAYKTSSALLAAIVVIAGPAFAQDAATTTLPESPDAATEQTADSPEQAGDAATTTTEGAADEAADAATDAAAPAATPAADAAETATEAAPETTEDAAQAETAPADAATPAADQPATTQDAATAAPAATPAEPTEPQVGAYYLKSTHSDWTIRCIKADEGQPDPCELYQLLKDGEGNSVAEVTMIPLTQGEAAAGATIVAPLETDLVRGLGLKIDSAAPRGYPFNFCAPVGCVSRMGFDTAGLAGLKRGNQATISLLPFGGNPEEPVELPMSLSGFTAAFSELEGIVAEAQAQIAAQPQSDGADAPAEGEAPAAEEAAPAN